MLGDGFDGRQVRRLENIDWGTPVVEGRRGGGAAIGGVVDGGSCVGRDGEGAVVVVGDDRLVDRNGGFKIEI